MQYASRSVPPAWAAAISTYLGYLTAAGQPATTRRTRREQLEHVARRSPSPDPWLMTGIELVEYAAAQDWARETRRGRRSAFRAFWAWGVRTGRAEANIADELPKVRAVDSEPNPAPEQVYQRALTRADERSRLILRLAREAGLRRGEIAVVHSRDLLPDLVGWSLLVQGKGGKRRVVPLTPRVAFDLRGLPEGWAFPGAIDGHLSPRRVGELAEAALDAPWTIHKLRARFATDALRSSGGNTLLVQQLMGHSNPNTTKRYVLVDMSDARRAVEAAVGATPLRVAS